MKSQKQQLHLQKLARMRKEGLFPPMSEESKRKIGLANSGPSKQKGYKRTSEQIEKNRQVHIGINKKEKAYQWKGGCWIWWQAEIKKRDKYTCKVCGLFDPEIVEVAHIIPIRGIKNRNTAGHHLNSYENLITLCPNDHTRFDKGIICLDKEVLGEN